MSIKYKNILAFCGLLLVLGACKEDELSPLHKDSTAPAAIAEATIVNLPGAAQITYQLPADDDLLYVKAEVEVSPGKIIQTKASIYSPELLLEGFGESKPFEVKLYAVDRSENQSVPVTVTVHPLTPPVQTIFAGIDVKPDFGGLTVTFENLTKANVAFVVMIKDEAGEWVERDTYYTKKEAGYFSSRGLPPVETEFMIFVKDRWDNRSDSSIYKLTPFFEELIPKAGFRTYNLPGDTYEAHANANWTVERLWDNITDNVNHLFHTKPNANPFPIHTTFDMGATARLSRFVMWGRQNVAYNVGNIRSFEIWGTADTPRPDGSWDGWTKLMEAESIKPSGEPVGTNTTEDLDTYKAGEEFNFPPGTPPVRYIRLRTKTTWGGVTYIHVGEVSLYGQRL